jgi:hypothetical protein
MQRIVFSISINLCSKVTPELNRISKKYVGARINELKEQQGMKNCRKHI